MARRAAADRYVSRRQTVSKRQTEGVPPSLESAGASRAVAKGMPRESGGDFVITVVPATVEHGMRLAIPGSRVERTTALGISSMIGPITTWKCINSLAAWFVVSHCGRL